MLPSPTSSSPTPMWQTPPICPREITRLFSSGCTAGARSACSLHGCQMVLYISVSIFEPYPLCGVDGASESDAARCSGGASVRGMVAWHSIRKSLQCAARVSATTGGVNIRVRVKESGALVTKTMASVDVHCRATPCDGCYVPHVVGPRW